MHAFHAHLIWSAVIHAPLLPFALSAIQATTSIQAGTALFFPFPKIFTILLLFVTLEHALYALLSALVVVLVN